MSSRCLGRPHSSSFPALSRSVYRSARHMPGKPRNRNVKGMKGGLKVSQARDADWRRHNVLPEEMTLILITSLRFH